MAKMSSSSELILLYAIKLLGVIFRVLPMSVSMALAGAAGWVGYFILSKKRRVVYDNLRTVYAGEKSPQDIRRISRRSFIHFVMNIVEFMCLPKIVKQKNLDFVRVDGMSNVDEAMRKGRGLILLAVHEGNWELASVVGSRWPYTYNIVANVQDKTPLIDGLLNQYRAISGAKVIAPGVATRDIIQALKNNEIISLVLDQGGAQGEVVEFLGKSASLSSGAIRLALKYGCAVCPVWIKRTTLTKHELTIYPALDIPAEDSGPDIFKNVMRQAARQAESLIQASPEMYMWFYKVFKYADRAHVLILDDSRTGHLRQSQAVGQILSDVSKQKNKRTVSKTITLKFKNEMLGRLFSVYSYWAQILGFLCREDVLKFFVMPDCYQELLSFKADYIISTGSTAGPLSAFLKRCYRAKTVSVLKPGMIPWNRFDAVIIPEHDRPSTDSKTSIAITKASLNLITPEYLKQQAELLEQRYAHLRANTRTKIGVLLGGDTKGVMFNEAEMRVLIKQIKDAALYFNADILLTTSRRTSKSIESLVIKELKGFPRTAVCVIANEHNFPEVVGGILGLSDIILVSGESISMVSEALSCRKRTIIFRPSGSYDDKNLNKYDRFVLSMAQGGYAMACSIKDVSQNIHQVWRNKIALKTIDDRAAVRQILEGMVS